MVCSCIEDLKKKIGLIMYVFYALIVIAAGILTS